MPTNLKEYKLKANIGIIQALVDCNLVPSTSQARRDIKAGAVRIDQEKVMDEKILLQSGEFILQKGKKNFVKIIVK